MTNEGAIEVLENGAWWDLVGTTPCGSEASVKFHNALEAAIFALRGQQAPMKLDRSRWEECGFCSRINPSYILDGILYCASCGRPLTEKAWAELERRIGGNDGTIDKNN